jgi:lysophospholipase L1-like esterase
MRSEVTSATQPDHGPIPRTGAPRPVRYRSAKGHIGAALALAMTLIMSGCAGNSALQSTPSASERPPLSLVAIGDSIPYNDPGDCSGCVGFVSQYAKALAAATGREVKTANWSQHNGLTLPMLTDELWKFEDELRNADAIIVGIAHNSFPLNEPEPCGTKFDEPAATFEDWSALNASCATRATKTYQPMYEHLYSAIAELRGGKPTIMLTINKYSDWLGWPKVHFTADQQKRTVKLHDAWNAMLCDAAERNAFTCVDVYHQFNGPHGTTPSGDLLAADYTHPSQKGNDAIAKALVAKGFAPLA